MPVLLPVQVCAAEIAGSRPTPAQNKTLVPVRFPRVFRITLSEMPTCVGEENTRSGAPVQ
jgi:hypothetical protein